MTRRDGAVGIDGQTAQGFPGRAGHARAGSGDIGGGDGAVADREFVGGQPGQGGVEPIDGIGRPGTAGVAAGVGDGGAMATIRLDYESGAGPDAVHTRAQSLSDTLLTVTGACCVHIGLARTEVSGVKTRETELRPGMAEKEFDMVVLIEGSGAPELETAIPAFEAVIAESGSGVTNPQTIVYNLAYQLTAADMAGTGAAQ